MKTWATSLFATCALLSAASAHAELYSATGKLTCYETALGGPARYSKFAFDDELAAVIASSSPVFANRFALTFDGETGDFAVVQRCDGMVLTPITDNRTCASAGHTDASGQDFKLACFQDAVDWGATPVDGATLCLLAQRWKTGAPAPTFKGKCEGTLLVDDTPCWLQLKAGKAFVPSGPCPK